MAIDENGDGRLEYDECIAVAYRRYGRQAMERVSHHFQLHKDATTGSLEMDFREFTRMMDDLAKEEEEEKRKELEASGIFGTQATHTAPRHDLELVKNISFSGDISTVVNQTGKEANVRKAKSASSPNYKNVHSKYRNIQPKWEYDSKILVRTTPCSRLLNYNEL